MECWWAQAGLITEMKSPVSKLLQEPYQRCVWGKTRVWTGDLQAKSICLEAQYGYVEGTHRERKAKTTFNSLSWTVVTSWGRLPDCAPLQCALVQFSKWSYSTWTRLLPLLEADISRALVPNRNMRVWTNDWSQLQPKCGIGPLRTGLQSDDRTDVRASALMSEFTDSHILPWAKC